MQEELPIVDAISSDVERINDLLRETWLDTYPNEKLGITKNDILGRFDIDKYKESLENRKKTINANSNEHTWVIRDKEKVIAMCAAIKEAENGRIQALYVLPQYQKSGLGKKLMKEAIEWLGNEMPIIIHAAIYNQNAVNFYKSLGFKETKTPINPFDPNFPSGVLIPQLELRRP